MNKHIGSSNVGPAWQYGWPMFSSWVKQTYLQFTLVRLTDVHSLHLPDGRCRVFLFATASRLGPGPTQPPIQWKPRHLSLGVKPSEHEYDHPLHLTKRSKVREALPSLPVLSRGMMLRHKGTSFNFRISEVLKLNYRDVLLYYDEPKDNTSKGVTWQQNR